MKNAIIYCSVLAAGVLLGSIATTGLAAKRIGRECGRLHFVKVFDDAALAVELQSGRQREALARLVSQLPQHAASARQLDRSSDFYTNAMWMIRAYYEKSGTQVPHGLASAFAALPAEPPPICRNRLRDIEPRRPAL